MTDSANKFVWYDLMTTDMAAAERFYGDVIGWDAKDAGMPGAAYTLLSAGTEVVGGLMHMPKDTGSRSVHPAWMGHIGVDDVDAYVGRLSAAGGAVHRPPTDIPGIGRFAVVADPHGASFILFHGSGTPPVPPEDAAAPGHIGWRELQAGDLKSDFAFYAELFGWTRAEALDMGAMGTYQMFAAGDRPIGGMMTKMPEVPAPFWLYYFNVEAIDAAADRVREGGGDVLNGPMQVPGGSWIVQCTDPQGAMFGAAAAKR